MYTKVMRWSREHRDHYVYDPETRMWHKEQCMHCEYWDQCTAPATFPRGTQFHYNSYLGDYFGARNYR